MVSYRLPMGTWSGIVVFMIVVGTIAYLMQSSKSGYSSGACVHIPD